MGGSVGVDQVQLHVACSSRAAGAGEPGLGRVRGSWGAHRQGSPSPARRRRTCSAASGGDAAGQGQQADGQCGRADRGRHVWRGCLIRPAAGEGGGCGEPSIMARPVTRPDQRLLSVSTRLASRACMSIVHERGCRTRERPVRPRCVCRGTCSRSYASPWAKLAGGRRGGEEGCENARRGQQKGEWLRAASVERFICASAVVRRGARGFRRGPRSRIASCRPPNTFKHSNISGHSALGHRA